MPKSTSSRWNGIFSHRLRTHLLSHARRKALVQPDHPRLGIARQCELVSATSSTTYDYQPSGESDLNLGLMRLIDKQYLKRPITATGR